jgi:hypothetical protein
MLLMPPMLLMLSMSWMNGWLGVVILVMDSDALKERVSEFVIVMASSPQGHVNSTHLKSFLSEKITISRWTEHIRP